MIQQEKVTNAPLVTIVPKDHLNQYHAHLDNLSQDQVLHNAKTVPPDFTVLALQQQQVEQ